MQEIYSKFARYKMREASIESKDSSHPDKGGHAVIHILVVLFGISAWIGVNGIFIQLPVLVNTAPEGWNLPAYIVVVVQAANVGPAIYALLQHLQFKLNESLCILALLASGTLAMGLSTFLYDKTIIISGTEHSIVLFVLVFFLALVGCFSSVLFMPYLRDFKHIYIVSYFIGEGLSGVLPSVVALIQGVEGNSKCNVESNSTLVSDISILRFAPEDYFSFIFSVFLVSLIAFIILNYSSFVREKKLPYKSNDVQIVANTSQNECNISTNNVCDKSIQSSLSKSPNDTVVENASTPSNEVDDLSRFTRSYLFTLISILCFLGNGFLPSVQSYSCLPYGNLAYQLSITFAQFANPAVCSLALWIRPSGVKTINCLSAICLAVGSYVTYLALMSPLPPLQKSKFGVALVVISWTILIGLISYVKLIIVSVFRHRPTSKSLFYVGAVMQAGSACGAILSFVLINFTKFFRVYDPCSITNT